MSKRHWTKQNRIRVVENSSFEVSDPSEVPRIAGIFFFLFQEVNLFCVRSINCARAYQRYFFMRRIFFRKKHSNYILDLRSYYLFDSLKHRFELKSPISK